MNAARALLPALLLALLASGAEAQGGLVIDVDELARRIQDANLVVLQVGRPDSYAAGHVPGAQELRLDDIAAPMSEGGNHDEHLSLELPPHETLRGVFEGLGVSDDSRIVVVFKDGWVTPAARVMFTLDYLGLGDRASFLDGGFEAWVAAGQPVSTEEPTVQRGHLTVGPADRVVDHAWVEANGDAEGVALLDGRAQAFYDGVRPDGGAVGHIPGAASVPWGDLWVERDGIAFLRPADELRDRFAEAGVQEGDQVVAYCHIGQYGTAVLLAARSLGYATKLYDGSMNEWRLLELPLETAGR